MSWHEVGALACRGGAQSSRLIRRRAWWTICIVAVAAVNHSNAQEAKPAEPTVVEANQAVRSQLPFHARQDFEDARLHRDHGRPVKSEPLPFLNGDAPPTVNPSLWRQAQLNVP